MGQRSQPCWTPWMRRWQISTLGLLKWWHTLRWEKKYSQSRQQWAKSVAQHTILETLWSTILSIAQDQHLVCMHSKCALSAFVCLRNNISVLAHSWQVVLPMLSDNVWMEIVYRKAIELVGEFFGGWEVLASVSICRHLCVLCMGAGPRGGDSYSTQFWTPGKGSTCLKSLLSALLWFIYTMCVIMQVASLMEQ